MACTWTTNGGLVTLPAFYNDSNPNQPTWTNPPFSHYDYSSPAGTVNPQRWVTAINGNGDVAGTQIDTNNAIHVNSAGVLWPSGGGSPRSFTSLECYAFLGGDGWDSYGIDTIWQASGPSCINNTGGGIAQADYWGPAPPLENWNHYYTINGSDINYFNYHDITGNDGRNFGAINDAGQLVGSTANGQAALFNSSGSPTSTFGPGSLYAINNATPPQMLGYLTNGLCLVDQTDNQGNPTNSYIPKPIQQLIVGSTNSPWGIGSATAINDHGLLTGTANYTPTNSTDTNTPGSHAVLLVPCIVNAYDRAVVGNITAPGGVQNVSIHIHNKTTGQDLGTFDHLLTPVNPDTSKPYVYAQQSDILSDTEVQDYQNGNADPRTLNQKVVFWLNGAGSTVVNFSTAFDDYGTVQIDVSFDGKQVFSQTVVMDNSIQEVTDLFSTVAQCVAGVRPAGMPQPTPNLIQAYQPSAFGTTGTADSDKTDPTQLPLPLATAGNTLGGTDTVARVDLYLPLSLQGATSGVAQVLLSPSNSVKLYDSTGTRISGSLLQLNFANPSGPLIGLKNSGTATLYLSGAALSDNTTLDLVYLDANNSVISQDTLQLSVVATVAENNSVNSHSNYGIASLHAANAPNGGYHSSIALPIMGGFSRHDMSGLRSQLALMAFGQTGIPEVDVTQYIIAHRTQISALMAFCAKRLVNTSPYWYDYNVQLRAKAVFVEGLIRGFWTALYGDYQLLASLAPQNNNEWLVLQLGGGVAGVISYRAALAFYSLCKDPVATLYMVGKFIDSVDKLLDNISDQSLNQMASDFDQSMLPFDNALWGQSALTALGLPQTSPEADKIISASYGYGCVLGFAGEMVVSTIALEGAGALTKGGTAVHDFGEAVETGKNIAQQMQKIKPVVPEVKLVAADVLQATSEGRTTEKTTQALEGAVDISYHIGGRLLRDCTGATAEQLAIELDGDILGAEELRGALQRGEISIPTRGKAIEYIQKYAKVYEDTSVNPASWRTTIKPGNYAIFYDTMEINPETGLYEPAGHVVYGKIEPDGFRWIYDNQSGTWYQTIDERTLFNNAHPDAEAVPFIKNPPAD